MLVMQAIIKPKDDNHSQKKPFFLYLPKPVIIEQFSIGTENNLALGQKSIWRWNKKQFSVGTNFYYNAKLFFVTNINHFL